MTDSLPQLQAERMKLETERDNILSAIRDLRQRAREKSIIAQDTRQPLARTEIAFWQQGIAEYQKQLMSVQSKLGTINKRLREQHAHNGSQTREPASEEQHHTIFLSCFHQIVRDSVDPRLFRALEHHAHALALDYERMHAPHRSAPGTGPRSIYPHTSGDRKLTFSHTDAPGV